jgi:GTP-binding protein
MGFVDLVKIKAVAGRGGDGKISFRREKGEAFGGPDGGNGGHGGNVYIVGTRDKTSLLDFKYRPKYEAKRGQHGKGSDMDGRAGEDMLLSVPLGTLIYDAETGEEIHDLCEENKPLLIARGGKGGRGNKSFVSSVLRGPRICTPGAEGQVRELKLELRLLADVGLIGLPNAGKSTLLKTLSRATPKIASYPFTTLQPNLGVVYHKEQSFVMADLPGLIEGASEGQGLGIQFLKHASRNKLLLHLVEISQDTEEIKKNSTDHHIMLAIQNMRTNNVSATPGYDGVFGVIDVLGGEKFLKPTQANLW